MISLVGLSNLRNFVVAKCSICFLTLYDMIRKKTYPKDQLLERLRPFTSVMSADEQDELLRACAVFEYGKGGIIYREGDVVRSMFCLLQGAALVYVREDSLHEQIVKVLCAGDFFGLRSYFTGQNYITSCVATPGTLVCEVPMSHLIIYIKQNPDLIFFFLKQYAADLGMADRRYVRLTQKHLRGRLADTLIYLTRRFGLADDGCTLGVSFSREELANMSNMTTSNAIRTLSAFVDEGVVAIDRRTIRILDFNMLHSISKHD